MPDRPPTRAISQFVGDLIAPVVDFLGFGPPKPAIAPPYVDTNATWRKIVLVVVPLALAITCFAYGFFFALTVPFMAVAFVAPIALLFLASIWALPDRPHAPTRTMELLFAAFLVCLILWPNYLAFALPGLPWITAIRLTGIPMAMLFLVSLSVSQSFRQQIRDVALAIPGLWIWMAALVVVQVITIPVASYPGDAVQKFVIQQVTWTIMAAAAAWIMRKRGRAERYFSLLLLTLIPMAIISQWEFSKKRLLWLGKVPSFLKLEDPIAATIFKSIFRLGNGVYRTKATFSTPLGLAEYTALLTPFAIHFALGRYNIVVRVMSFIALPVIFYVVRLTDGRLGVIGFLVSLFIYLLFWGLLRFKRNRRDLIGVTLVYAYPALFLLGGVAITAIHPLKVLVFGGGTTEASNAARQHQLHVGLPKILARPWGHGAGGGGKAMGYAAGDFIAIDNYYLSLGLDYGLLGLAAFVGVFLITITYAARSALAVAGTKDRELTMLVPLAVCMSEFLVIKCVLAQADLNPLMFMMVGASAALVYRARLEAKHLIKTVDYQLEAEREARAKAPPKGVSAALAARLRAVGTRTK